MVEKHIIPCKFTLKMKFCMKIINLDLKIFSLNQQKINSQPSSCESNDLTTWIINCVIC